MDPRRLSGQEKERFDESQTFEAGQEEVRAEFEGALLEGEIGEFAQMAGVVPAIAGATNVAATRTQTQAEARRPPQVIHQVQVQRVVLKEPPFEFMIEAEKVLKRLVAYKACGNVLFTVCSW